MNDIKPYELAGIWLGLTGGSAALLATFWKLAGFIRGGYTDYWPWKVSHTPDAPTSQPASRWDTSYPTGSGDFWLCVKPRQYTEIKVVGVRFQKRWKVPFTSGNVPSDVIEVVNLRDASLQFEPKPHGLRNSSPTPDLEGGMRLRYSNEQGEGYERFGGNWLWLKVSYRAPTTWKGRVDFSHGFGKSERRGHAKFEIKEQ